MKNNLPGRTIKDIDTDTQAHTPTVKIEGSRIINIQKLQQYINVLTVHATQCGGSVILTGEEMDWLLFCPVTVPLATIPSLWRQHRR